MATGDPVIIGANNQGSTTILSYQGVASTYYPTLTVLNGPIKGGGAIIARSDGDTAIKASSIPSYGLYASSSSDTGARCFGIINGIFANAVKGAGIYAYSRDGAGVVGQSGNPADYAGFFWGNVWINGNLYLAGAKSAAVPHPDGSHRVLYAVESPDSWFEDFGRARLVRGRARVKLDRDFALLVRAGNYHVFISAEGDSSGLYVSRKDATGFEVREQQQGDHSLNFSYRVVAKRKDIPGTRLAKVKPPPRPKLPKNINRPDTGAPRRRVGR